MTSTALAFGAHSRKVTFLSGSTWVILSLKVSIGAGSAAGARVVAGVVTGVWARTGLKVKARRTGERKARERTLLMGEFG